MRLAEIMQAATFYDHIKTIYQFIKPFLGKKMSFFEEYGAFQDKYGKKLSCPNIEISMVNISNYVPILILTYVIRSSQIDIF